METQVPRRRTDIKATPSRTLSSPTSRGPGACEGAWGASGDLHVPSEGKPSSKQSTSRVPSPPEPETQDKRPSAWDPYVRKPPHRPCHSTQEARRPKQQATHKPTASRRRSRRASEPTSGPAPEVHARGGSEETMRPSPRSRTRREPEACPAATQLQPRPSGRTAAGENGFSFKKNPIPHASKT